MEIVRRLLRKLSRDLLYDPAIPLPGMCPKERRAGPRTNPSDKSSGNIGYSNQKTEATQRPPADGRTNRPWLWHPHATERSQPSQERVPTPATTPWSPDTHVTAAGFHSREMHRRRSHCRCPGWGRGTGSDCSVGTRSPFGVKCFGTG